MNEDARLMQWLGSHRREAASSADPGLARAHVDIDTLTRHATGRLSPPQAQAVSEHLLVCDDARCVEFVRAQASDVDAAADFLYPPADEHASTPRTFMCKEALWDMIAEVAAHTGQSLDEVLNDAMLQYAHSRGYHEGPTARRPGDESRLGITQSAPARMAQMSSQVTAQAVRPAGSITTTALREDELSESEPSARGRGGSAPPATQRLPAHTPEAVPRAPPSVRSPAASPPVVPPSPLAAMSPPARPMGSVPPAPPPPPAPMRRPMPSPLGAPPPSQRALAPPSSRRAPPPLPSTPSVPMAPPMAALGSMALSKRLVLSFGGQDYEVDKEHFIIGRSKAQADLRIDDTNVSRQHAAIERIGSIYYLVDLGSTNGVYIGDDRITRRALANGDEIVITTHRIRCRLG